MSEGSGYKRPPKYGQFRKGKSGNPRGRPKRKKFSSEKELLREILREPMPIRENGISRTVPKSEAMIRMLVHKGGMGDFQSFQTIRNWLSALPEHRPPLAYLVVARKNETPGEFLAEATLLRSLLEHDAFVVETKEKLEAMREEIVRRIYEAKQRKPH